VWVSFLLLGGGARWVSPISRWESLEFIRSFRVITLFNCSRELTQAGERRGEARRGEARWGEVRADGGGRKVRQPLGRGGGQILLGSMIFDLI